MQVRVKLVAANWKMNGSRADNERWLKTFRAAPPQCQTVICPPFVYLSQVVEGLAGTPTEVGAQNLCALPAGAWTGEVAAEMLTDLGASWVIVGHSERRSGYGETDEIVATKLERALAAGLRPIVCVGETLEQREQGRPEQVVVTQLDALLRRCSAAQLARGAVAYEPIWAIGTGRTATPQQAQQMHEVIRTRLAGADGASAAATRLLYGGSVKPANAAELFSQADIDGGLIGGASLNAADFLAICAAAR